MKARRDVTSEAKGVALVAGRFRPNGSSAVDTTLSKGVGFTPARTGTGVFRITFTEKYQALLNFQAQLWLNAASDQKIDVGAYVAPTSTASGYIDITVWDISGAAAADISSNANNWISFVAHFQATSVAK